MPAVAQSSPFQWGFQGSLGLPIGDLKDTTKGPCLSLGGHLDFSLAANQTLRLRLDGLFFQAAEQQAAGVSGGNAWARQLETRVQGWALGAEYLVAPFESQSNLTFGAGLQLVRWSMDATSTLALTVGTGPGMSTGTVIGNSKPTWSKLGISLLAAYRINRSLGVEARLLSSAYGWEGERAQVGQFGLTWTF